MLYILTTGMCVYPRPSHEMLKSVCWKNKENVSKSHLLKCLHSMQRVKIESSLLNCQQIDEDLPRTSMNWNS